jgi:hypothetical protein
VTAYTSDDELDLIDMSLQDEVKGSAPSRNVLEHDLKAAPVLTRSVLTAFRDDGYFPQYGLLGTVRNSKQPDNRIYLNTNTPISTIVCGVQGSGKSQYAL